MIKHVFSLSLLAATTLVSTNALADISSGGTITFSGAITDTTCTINGNKSASFSVLLDPITVTDAGITVGLINKNKKPFALTLTDCTTTGTGGGTVLKMYFSSANNISTDGKYLVNNTTNETDTSSTSLARNVGFALTTNGGTTPIPFNVPYTTAATGVAPTTGPDTSTVNFDAHYYKPNILPARVGSLSSNVIYTISYL